MQMRKRWEIVAVCLGVAVLAGCSKKADKGQPVQSAQPTQAGQSAQPGQSVQPARPVQPAGTAKTSAATRDAAPDYAKMAEQNRQALAQMNGGKVIEAVPGATLKALLPAELPGLKRTDATAERTQSMGVDMSNAEGEYEATDASGARIRIKLTDSGSMSGSMRRGMNAWIMAEYNRETDTGYEKTTTINGCRAMEKYNMQDKEGSLEIMVADRFIVNVQGYGVTMEALKQAVDKIDLKKVAAVAP